MLAPASTPVPMALMEIWARIWSFIVSILWPSQADIPRVGGYSLLGMLPLILNGKFFSKGLSDLFETAKDTGLSATWLGTFPLIYIRDPSVFRQIFVDNADKVTRVTPQGHGPFGILKRIVGEITVTAEGHSWRRWRKGILNDFSNNTSLKESYKGIFNIAQKHVQRMREDNEFRSLHLRQVMEDYALDTAWYVAAGVQNTSDDTKDFLSPLPRVFDVLPSATHLLWHALRNLIRGKSYTEPDEVEKRLGYNILEAVTNYLKAHLDDPWDKRPGEFRYSFLQKVSQQSGGTVENPITPDVLTQAARVYAFGHEASELLLFWAVFELSQHPGVLKKLRQELHTNASSSWDLEYDDIRTMPYLDAVVNEMIRLHPPISTTTRLVTKPIIVTNRTSDTVVIPKGAQVYSSMPLLHHDEQVWGADANEFDPDRWTGRLRNEAENRCHLIPFLTGPRGCPSSGFVLLQLKVLLAVMFFSYDISLPESKTLEVKIGAIVEPAKALKFELNEHQQ